MENTLVEVQEEDMTMLITPNVNCYSALTQAPYLIQSLGHLLLISAERDFSLIEHLENAKFKYLHFPDSFRACLVQVFNGTWLAFEQAHNSMNRIRMKAINIDRDLVKAVQFILKGTGSELPIAVRCLANIEQKSNECADEAKSITEEFQKLVQTMNELTEACTGAKGRYGQERKKVFCAKEAAAKRKERMERDKEKLEELWEHEKSELNVAKKKFDKANKSYPSTWKLMLLGTMDGLAGFAHDITIALVPKFLLPFDVPVSVPSCPPITPEAPTSSMSNISNEEGIAYLAASNILDHAEQLLCFASDQNAVAVPEGKTSLENILEDLRACPSTPAAVKKAEKLCKDGVQICKDIEEGKDKWAIQNRIEKFHQQAESFKQKADTILKLLGTKPAASVNQNDESQRGFFAKTLLKNTERKQQEAKELLQRCYKRYDRCHKEMLQESRKMDKVLEDLSKFDHRTLDLEKIQHVLSEGLKALNNVIKHWKRFRDMFEELHNQIAEHLNPHLKRFNDTAIVGLENLAEIQGSSNSLMRRTIIKESDEARQIAYAVKHLSSVYVDVSQRYLLNGLIGLQRIVALDPERDRHEMEYTRKQLKVNCNKAKEGIQRIAEEKRIEISKKFGISEAAVKRDDRSVRGLMPLGD